MPGAIQTLASQAPFHRPTQFGLLYLGLVLIASVSGYLLIDEGQYGLFGVLPTAVVISTHRTLEALLAGALSGFIMVSPATAVQDMATSGLTVMQNPTIG